MNKSSSTNPTSSCRCQACFCRPAQTCICAALVSLLASAQGDYGRAVRRQTGA
ncbi:MAG TPA: hypothetical protein VHD61_16100 [Lacunisphaera sp.]|nr:hypothetical protein [Lacunisphaera sp.]